VDASGQEPFGHQFEINSDAPKTAPSRRQKIPRIRPLPPASVLNFNQLEQACAEKDGPDKMHLVLPWGLGNAYLPAPALPAGARTCLQK
jgi:hypothetical protein